MKNVLLGILSLSSLCLAAVPAEISGELKKWHKVTLTFNGPEVSEKNTH